MYWEIYPQLIVLHCYGNIDTQQHLQKSYSTRMYNLTSFSIPSVIQTGNCYTYNSWTLQQENEKINSR